jgi:hypothetical protein
MDSLEIQLVNISQTIGNIATSNNQYTACLATKLATLNKPLLSISLRELITLDRDFNNTFNKMMEN